MGLVYPHPQGNYKLQPSSACLRFSPRIPPNSSFAWKFPARQSSQEPSQICPGKRPLREYLICSGVPPDVALVMAQAASFLVRNSAFCRISISTGKMLASMTAWEERAGRGVGIVPKRHLSTSKKPLPPYPKVKNFPRCTLQVIPVLYSSAKSY